jgi:hypothetical protein
LLVLLLRHAKSDEGRLNVEATKPEPKSTAKSQNSGNLSGANHADIDFRQFLKFQRISGHFRACPETRQISAKRTTLGVSRKLMGVANDYGESYKAIRNPDFPR